MTTGGVMGGSDFRSNSSEDDYPNYPSTCPHCSQSICTCYSRLPASSPLGDRTNKDKSSSSFCRSKCGFLMGAVALFFLLPRLADVIFGPHGAPEQKMTSVIKLQVGLSGAASTLQRDLNLIAETADTSSREGFSLVLKETLLALLRHQPYCLYGFSSIDIKENLEDGKKWFDQLFEEERQKIDEVTIVNVNGRKKQSSASDGRKASSKEYIVVTALVATNGVYEPPVVVDGKVDLKQMLEKLGSVPTKINLAVQVLWTPRTEKDTLSRYELLEKYPLLEQNSYDGHNIAFFNNRRG
ncbi:FLUCTUATING-LIGHT-ACCLIMATION protein 1, chloroplastic-like [Aristolochia californica]|uniref:FLUCTUATING-LIGHT-ACCLIMATION protein 1, chloroplastic-like n=1 Tax=Aristolochia californica TaxID=171875 RepID=UPI0035D53F53